jgi:very-short-patch-repair endonuclease
VSAAQLAGFGITKRVVERMVAQGLITRITRGIYATGDGGWRQQAWAGVLLGGPSAVLGLHAAAFLHGLVPQPPECVAVFVAGQSRVRDPRWTFIRSPRLGSGEPPRTRPAQTVIDVAALAGADEVVTLLAEAIGRRGVRPRELVALLDDTPRHPHRRLLLEMVGEVAAGSQSPLEVRYARDVERAHGLPTARRQASPLGRYRCDAWYAEFGLLVELDGTAYHRGVVALADMDRDADHLMAGLVTLRLGWKQVVGDPCRVARRVAGTLNSLGWSGTLTRCARCRGGKV